MIRRDASMSTAGFCRLLQIPERSYRRWQQRQREGRPAKGPWPTAAVSVRALYVGMAVATVAVVAVATPFLLRASRNAPAPATSA